MGFASLPSKRRPRPSLKRLGMDQTGTFDLGRVHQTDCVAAMRTLPSSCIDHIITDPPYSDRVHEGVQQRATSDGYNRCTDFGFGCLTGKLQEDVAREFARLAKRWVLIFCDPLGLAGWRDVLEKHGLRYYRSGIWVKKGAAPSFHGLGPAEQFECVAIAHSQAGMRWNGGGKGAVWEFPIVHSDRVHNTQKPVPLMLELVREFSDEGELVLDPFSGGGTTGIACRQLGRRFLGFELEEKWVAAGNFRIATEGERLGEITPEAALQGQQIGLLPVDKNNG